MFVINMSSLIKYVYCELNISFLITMVHGYNQDTVIILSMDYFGYVHLLSSNGYLISTILEVSTGCCLNIANTLSITTIYLFVGGT